MMSASTFQERLSTRFRSVFVGILDHSSGNAFVIHLKGVLSG